MARELRIYRLRLARLSKRTGVAPRGLYSKHRGFGRISHDVGILIDSVQATHGHESPAATAFYIRIEENRIAAGLKRLAEVFA